MTDQELEELWAEFGDVPMDPETEKIEEDWNGFPAGTDREEIWHWFEERSPFIRFRHAFMQIQTAKQRRDYGVHQTSARALLYLFRPGHRSNLPRFFRFPGP